MGYIQHGEARDGTGGENFGYQVLECVCCLSGVGILLSCHGMMLGAGEFSLLCCWEEDF